MIYELITLAYTASISQNFREYFGLWRENFRWLTDCWLKYLARNIRQVNEKLNLLHTLLFLFFNFLLSWSLFGLQIFCLIWFDIIRYHRILIARKSALKWHNYRMFWSPIIVLSKQIIGDQNIWYLCLF